MMRRLGDGHYLGKLVRRETIADVVLTETRYAPRQQLPLHSHERAYICFVRRGGYTEHFATRTREAGPSTLALHPADEPHSQQFHDAEVWSFNVEFSSAWLKRVREAVAVLAQPVDFHGGPVVGLAQKLYREFRRPDTFSSLAIEGLLLELLAEAGRVRDRTACRQPPPWLARVRAELHARFDERLSLNCLATLAGVHPAHLAMTFSRHQGCTIGEYLRYQRVEYGRRRLTASTASLATIAAEAGFADQSHFTRVFRRLTGQTPRQYRVSAGYSNDAD
jgi:AraC family transcriptional regulator